MVEYAGSKWMKECLKQTGKNDEMSLLGKAVADLLGDVFLGIYHLDQKALLKVDWANNHHVIFNLSWRVLCTWDFDDLTRFVVLCHDRMIRMEIHPCGPHTLRLMFHQRTTREGNIGERYPTMEDHIAMIRSNYERQKE